MPLEKTSVKGSAESAGRLERDAVDGPIPLRRYLVGWYRPHACSSVSAISPTEARARTAAMMRGISAVRAPE